VVSFVLVDNGDNLLGGLLASALRGPYRFPSRHPQAIRPIPANGLFMLSRAAWHTLGVS